MIIAHISDIHLPTTRPRLQELVGKRFLAFLSWHHKRKKIHRPEVTQALLKDMRAQQPDHICVTGDVVNASFKSEFEQAMKWLEDLAPPKHISFVPGNHDALVKSAEQQKGRYFWRWAESDDHSNKLPYIQRKGKVAFIGLDSAVATLPFLAQGELGEEQLARLAACLQQTKDEGLYRVVLIHHPPLPGMASWRKGLRDAAQLEVVLQECGADVVLHGHNHCPMQKTLETVDGATYIYGVGSGSMAHGHGKKKAAHYQVLRITDSGIEVTQKIYNAQQQKFVAFAP